MKILLKAASAATLLALAACGNNADDQAADNIEAMAENRADALESQADAARAAGNDQLHDSLEAQADNVEDMGEREADRADDSDDARVEGQVANRM
ncbi:hypothetical protein [Sphingomonas sp. M1-B02]|uniref:hypothetical protein n=1 Tax=Sphingomonas sp. M1-B02 TaxID=3114300 RepID=UPI00223EB3AB|nr:hypothetical protein [Sphingomonas sp. S6-11]UZK65503.1 hypothetical protein OKW87_13445 [Sphingomonas sp. S6-11]